MIIQDLRYLVKSSSLAGLVPYVSNSSSFNFKNTPVNQINPGELFFNQEDKKLWIAYQDASNNLGTILLYPQPISGGSTDVFVTGGTYSAGTATFTNNTGGTFSVSGFFTGGTSGTDVFVTGGTYSNGTAIFTNNTGGTFNVVGFYTGATDVFVTGGTYSNGNILFTNNTGGTFNVSGLFTGSTDVYVTGATYSNNTFTYTNNTGGTFDVNFNSVTGLTSTGTISSSVISATTYQNLPTDIMVTGGTYSAGTATFTNNTGGTFNVTGFSVSGTLILLDAQETQTTGTANQTGIFTYTVASNTYSRIMVESEVGFRSNANANGLTTFVLEYGGVTKRDALIEFDATGAGDQHAAGYTLKYSEAFTGGGVVRINTTGVANGTWTVESFRVYGII